MAFQLDLNVFLLETWPVRPEKDSALVFTLKTDLLSVAFKENYSIKGT
jgi:hypothetical protein